MQMGNDLRQDIRALLDAMDYKGISALYKKSRSVLRTLITMTYDLHDVISRRAIEAVGILTMAMTDDAVRTQLQRILWMMREESGNNAASAPDLLAEILANHPGKFSDFIPIVVSFHDENFFRPGVMRAMNRLAQSNPGSIAPHAETAAEYLNDNDPEVRGHALMCLMAVNGDRFIDRIRPMAGDRGVFKAYQDGLLNEISISALAGVAVQSLAPSRQGPA